MCRMKHEKRSCLLKKQLLVYLLKIVLFVGVHDSSLRSSQTCDRYTER